MNVFQLGRSEEVRPSDSQRESRDYVRLITDNLTYIENQCRRAVLRSSTSGEFGAEEGGFPGYDGIQVDNQVDELLNEVLDRLRADDFKALREFKGRAKVTTYITTIISNLIIDLVRQKKGRSRARERAREMGEVGERLYELVFTRGCTVHQAQSHLEITHNIREPLERLQQMLQKMRGREKPLMSVADGESTWLVPGRKVVVNDATEIVVADPRKNAEAALISHQKQGEARQTVAELIAELSGEDRLLLTMRFPPDDEEPKSAKEIGALLGLTEKCVDARVRRMLIRFRETLLKQGVTLKDLVE